MKILYLCSSADWHMVLWLKYFADRHEVLLFSDREDYLPRQQFGPKVQVIERYGHLGRLLGALALADGYWSRLDKLLSTGRYTRHIQRIVDEQRVDIIHAHSLYYGFLAAGIRRDVPVVFTPMGSDVILYAQTNPIHKRLARAAFARADVVTGDSILLQTQGYKVGARPDHNHIVQNGVDTEVVHPRRTDLKRRLGVADDETLIFSPRALAELYNIDVILRSIALLRDRGRKVRCMFSYAFGGEYVRGLKELTKELSLEKEVIWLGFLQYHEMAEHYNAADIVVSVPRSDSSPKSVYEAMFCRKPVVVSDLEWSHELLAGEDCVLRVKPGDAGDLAAALERLLDDRELRARLSANAYRKANEHFDYHANMRRMEDIMLAAVARAPAARRGAIRS